MLILVVKFNVLVVEEAAGRGSRPGKHTAPLSRRHTLRYRGFMRLRRAATLSIMRYFESSFETLLELLV